MRNIILVILAIITQNILTNGSSICNKNVTQALVGFHPAPLYSPMVWSYDTLSLTKYFFSKDFHNGLLGAYDVRKNYYLARLIDTKSQLNKVKSTYHKYYFN